MKTPGWVEGSFLDNLDKIALKVGYDNIPFAKDLARVNWASPAQRDQIVDAIIRVPTNQVPQ